MFNRHCEEVTGLSSALAIGQEWPALFVDEARRPGLVALWQTLRSGTATEPFESLCRNRRRLMWRFAEWPGGGPGRAGICAVGLDVTTERDARHVARLAGTAQTLGHLGAGLAHEIRNPLNSAALQLALAERRIDRLPGSGRDGIAIAVRRAVQEIGRAAALLEDFLAFARPNALTLARIDARELLAAAADRASALASAAEVALAVEPGPPVQCEADRERLLGAVYNLVENAIDAAASAPGPGRVDLRLSLEWNTLVIEVSDNGPGLPSADAPIFDPFFTTKSSGTGLGLAIVDRTAADHGGSVRAERAGEATRFLLRLPIVAGGSD